MMDALMTAFNRQGFTDGYYTNRVDKKMFGVRLDTRDDPQWLQAARQSFEAGETQLVDLKFRAVVTVDGSSLPRTDPDDRCDRELKSAVLHKKRILSKQQHNHDSKCTKHIVRSSEQICKQIDKEHPPCPPR